MFIFTLNNNGRCGIKKFDNKDGKTYTWICNNKNYYYCYGYDVRQIDTNDSFIWSSIGDDSGIEKTALIGNYNTDHFTTTRIIVIQMK